MRPSGARTHDLSANEYRILTESSPVLIWRSGKDALCNYFNETWLEFTGRSIDQELGNGWAEGVHPEDLPDCLRIYLSSFDTRSPFEMRYRLRRRDGAYRYLLDRGVPFYDEADTFEGFIGSCIDVHDAHQAQLMLRAQEQQALATSDAIQRRIGRDLHDGLGQLLTGSSFIAKEIEHAVEGPLKARATRLIELLAKSVEHAHGLAKGLAPLHLEAMGLEKALYDLATMTSHAHGVTCELTSTMSVEADVGTRTQLFLITQEAIANALRHGEAKHIAIELTSSERSHRLRIIDNGCGMQPQTESGGLGLQSMAQRARLIGGVLEVGPAAQGGVEVRCTW
jgi:PAS domain S-box-containing protein